jgi:hypothetical protein
MGFLLFLLDDGRIRIWEAQKLTDHTDPDPNHWFLLIKIKIGVEHTGSTDMNFFPLFYFLCLNTGMS